MAGPYYVWSGATGTGTGASWANAYTTLVAAFVPEVAGDTLYVAHDHAEATAGITLTSSGTLGNPTKVICANRSGSVPPVSADRRATATITSTSTNNLSIGGSTHYDGIIFTAGTGATPSAQLTVGAAANTSLRFDNCSLRIGITGASGGNIVISGSSNQVGNTWFEFNNTTMSFGNATNTVAVAGAIRWRNTPSALLGSIPTILFTTVGARGGFLECSGVDFSAAGSGKTLVDSSVSSQGFTVRFVDCKLGASVTKMSAGVGQGGVQCDFVRSGSSGVNYAVNRSNYSGTLDEETTIVRTGGGGASNGTTTISWKIVTTANSTYTFPFECPPIAIWNDVTGSTVTATVEGIWGGGAVPNDDDVWVEVEYLGDASSPQASFVNDGKADLLTTAAGQTSSSSTWGGSTTKFKLNVSFTAQQKGFIYARVKCAKLSTTFYIDPLVTLT